MMQAEQQPAVSEKFEQTLIVFLRAGVKRRNICDITDDLGKAEQLHSFMSLLSAKPSLSVELNGADGNALLP